MTRIYIDADACPVKDEVYRVAGRYGLPVYVVSNRLIAIPAQPGIERVVVDAGADVADDWIAERAGVGDVVITADIPLAARCVAKKASVLEPKGRELDGDAIGMALAVRNLMDDLRSTGTITTGSAPFSKNDRSTFLSALDRIVVRLRKTARLTIPRPPEGI